MMNLRQVYRVPREELRVYIFGAYLGGHHTRFPPTMHGGSFGSDLCIKEDSLLSRAEESLILRGGDSLGNRKP